MSAARGDWWPMRHRLLVDEMTTLVRRTSPGDDRRWALVACLDVLLAHVPDRRGRCPLCRSTRWLRRSNCRLAASLLAAREFRSLSDPPGTVRA